MLVKPLHEYQNPPVDIFLDRGSLLVAFDPGLGKTAMGIACAEELLGCGDINFCLVVCDSNLKYQWAQEIAQFTDVPNRLIKLKVDGEAQEVTVPGPRHCTIVEGKTFQRQRVKFTAADDRDRQYASITPTTDYVIVSYDNVIDDGRAIANLNPGMVILDEATAIKTFAAERTKRVKDILNAPYRLALTATPVDNKAEELFSIMEWVDPEVLGRWDLFEAAYIVRDDYGKVTRYKHLDVMRERVGVAMARISHSDQRVRDFIPDVVETTLSVDPGEAYPAFLNIAEELLAKLKTTRVVGGFDLASYYAGKHDESNAAGMVMAMYGAADLLLAHPDMLVLSAQAFADSAARRAKGEKKAVWPGSGYAYAKWQEGLVDDLWTSPKLERLVARIPEILGEDEAFKVLVFTRWPAMLGYIADRLDVPCVQYHGGMDARSKAAAQAQFTSRDDVRVFLSSHAGGRGTNLFTASHLINYDLPWSSGMSKQINGRHVRASNRFPAVWVENMVVRGTTEEWKQDVLGFKHKTAAAILDGEGHDRLGGVVNEGRSLTTFLTELLDGAYPVGRR